MPVKLKEWAGEDVKALRTRFGESQAEFALRFRVELTTVQKWEQSQRLPGPCCQRILDQLEQDFNRLFPDR